MTQLIQKAASSLARMDQDEELLDVEVEIRVRKVWSDITKANPR